MAVLPKRSIAARAFREEGMGFLGETLVGIRAQARDACDFLYQGRLAHADIANENNGQHGLE